MPKENGQTHRRNRPRQMQRSPALKLSGLYLLSLPSLRLGLCELLLSPLLGGLGTSFSVKAEVPPPEAAGIVANELLMVNIMVLSTSPEGKEVMQAPGEFVTAVRIDGLEHAKDDPGVHCKDVEILGDGAPENWTSDCAET